MKNTRSIYKKTGTIGFTIVELAVIIVVIVILASIVIVSYRQVTRDSQLETAKADAQSAAVAINKYKADTGAYPANLSQVTMTKAQSELNYYPNGQLSYCVSASFHDELANVVAGKVTADEGDCAVKTPTAPGATISNLATNPSAENNLSGVSGYFSASPRRVSGGVSGNASFAVTTTSTTNTQGLIHSVTDTVPGKQYTCSLSFKGTNGVTVTFSGRAANGSGGYNGENFGSKTVQLSSSAWTRKTISFTMPSNSARMLVQYVVPSSAVGTTIQTDALMCTEGPTAYLYADGDSTGWSWVGPRQQSASTGPSLGIEPAN